MESANLQELFERVRAQTIVCPDTGCWEWQGPVFGGHDVRRYARVGRKTYGHRLMYELTHGLIPRGQHVCHRCDNTLCLNPDHLFLGTNTENRHDSVAKGRHSHGVTHHWATLDEATVLAIREARRSGLTLTQLAKQFGVPYKTIDKIVYRVSWRHLP